MKDYLLEKINTKKLDKRGLSALAWIILGVLLMFVLLIPVEMALQSVIAHEFNGALDSAVNSAVVTIDEDFIAAGEIKFNRDKAIGVIYDSLATTYNLEYRKIGNASYEFVPESLENSKLAELPYVEVQFIDFSRDEVLAGSIKHSQPFSDVVLHEEESGKDEYVSHTNGYIHEGVEQNTVVLRVIAEFPSMLLSARDGFTLDRVSTAEATMIKLNNGG